MFDFNARMYYPQLGRTWQVDPMAHLFNQLSPYSWAINNPVSYVDPTGMVVEASSQKEWDKQKKALTDERYRVQNKIADLNAKATEKGWSADK